MKPQRHDTEAAGGYSVKRELEEVHHNFLDSKNKKKEKMSDLFSRPSFEDYYQTLKKRTAIQAETFSFFLVLSPSIKSAPDHDTSVFLGTVFNF